MIQGNPNKVTPIIEQRQGERRADWHTPEDCFKLLDVQAAMDTINKRLDEGQRRMDKIEDTIFANHLESMTERKHQNKLLEENTAVTKEIKELISAGKGFRKVVMWTVPMATVLVSFYYAMTGQIK